MVGQHQDLYVDSDTIPSEDEYECYRAAYNNTATIFCVDSIDGTPKDLVVLESSKPVPVVNLNPKPVVKLEDRTPTEKLIVQLDNAIENIMEDTKDEECWDVDYADMNKHKEISRYYSPVQMTCYNCDENGHVKYDCPKPKKAQPCLSCGETGHFYRDCSHALCYSCGYPGHTKKECSMAPLPSWKACTRCHTPGHPEARCPDKWRQYHATTTHGPPVRVTSHWNLPYKPTYCYNCGRQGHWGFDCPEEKPDESKYCGTQFVVRYDSTPVALSQPKKRKVKGKTPTDQTGYSDTVVSDSSAKNAAKKHRNKDLPRSKSLASAFPTREKGKDSKRRSKSLDESTNHGFKGTNLSKFKSRSHKSFEKLRQFGNDGKAGEAANANSEKPKPKYNKIKEELERMGINKNKKKTDQKKPKATDHKQNSNHVSFNEDKKNKRNRVQIVEDEYYCISKNRPHVNHLNEFPGERTKGKKGQKQQGPKKGGKKKNKKNNGFQKSNQVFS